jgi:hypothetical protein
MPDEQASKPVRTPRTNPQVLVLWALFLGLVVAFATNVTQDKKIDGLTRDLAAVKQETQKQVALLHEAQSAALEQDLLRLDQLNIQLQRTEDEQRKQAANLANQTRAVLAKTVEQRHQEMIKAISDMRADLRSQAEARASMSQAQRPDADPPKSSGASEASNVTAANNSASAAAEASEEKAGDDASNTTAPQKKSFWSKLNPFGRNKK